MIRYLLLLLLLAGCSPTPPDTPLMTVNQALNPENSEGFLQAIDPRKFEFPEDHGPHEGFRNEWWYITGNLKSEQGQRFGYQVTFFRIGLQPPGTPKRASRWAARHLWMAHVALTDFQQKRHYKQERFVREAVGLAGVSASPYRLWVEDWQISAVGPDFPWRLKIANETFSLDLTLKPVKQAVLQGDQGLSQKSSQTGNASYYYSFPRLETAGRLIIDGKEQSVSGLSWLDREWSSSALADNQSGWDWFSLQLKSGEELMYYRLRDKQQKSDPHSAGKWIKADGTALSLSADDLRLTPKRWWQSPKGQRYPVAWTMEIKPLGRRFQITTPVESQEMDLTVRYWEGAIEVQENNRLIGRGYLEMTGYTPSND
jgi:predicted secreted hydrolase